MGVNKNSNDGMTFLYTVCILSFFVVIYSLYLEFYTVDKTKSIDKVMVDSCVINKPVTDKKDSILLPIL